MRKIIAIMVVMMFMIPYSIFAAYPDYIEVDNGNFSSGFGGWTYTEKAGCNWENFSSEGSTLPKLAMMLRPSNGLSNGDWAEHNKTFNLTGVNSIHCTGYDQYLGANINCSILIDNDWKYKFPNGNVNTVIDTSSYSDNHYFILNISATGDISAGDWIQGRLYYLYFNYSCPEFDNLSVDPSPGYESSTTFYFNTSYKNINNASPDMFCNISLGTWYKNISMDWVDGFNNTCANYTCNTTVPTVGEYTYRFYSHYVIWNYTVANTFVANYNEVIGINYPTYMEVGDLIFSSGTIRDTSNNPVSGLWVQTWIINSTWDKVYLSKMHRYLDNGSFIYTFSTSTMIPGVYNILTNYSVGAINHTSNSTLYLSVPGGPGHYPADAHFTFYNSKSGMGLDSNSFKIYVNSNTMLTTVERLYGNIYYNTYTGQTLYYRIDDYFDNQVFPTVGTYETVTITDLYQGIDVPITWYDVATKNMNTSIMLFSMQNGTTYYNVTLFPGEEFHFNVLAGFYNITKDFYDQYDSSLIRSEIDTITIADDSFYVSTKPVATVHFTFYNTNEGLGLDTQTLKIYINGSRLIGNTFITQMNSTINLTIRDYYDLTMYWDNITIDNTYTFIDLGLTFHSWLFGNMNEDYYMISIRKAGGTRWWERGIVPYGEREFLIPSGTYALRIYDHNDVEIYNSTLPESVAVVNSRVYVIYGTNLSEVISGQSVIVGDLLEIQIELDDATRPDIVLVGCDLPHIYSIYDKKGMTLGSVLVCPPIVYFATTTNSSTFNDTTVIYPLIPDSDSDNGTIYVREDIMSFYGNETAVNWVNVSYNGDYTNYTYMPPDIDPEGANVTVTANSNITVVRITEYESQDDFYWTKYLDTVEYEATITITNPFKNNEIENVYCHMGFANDSTPDYGTVTFYDVTNGVYLTEGENFMTISSGIEWYLANISKNSSRSFTGEYTGETGAITPGTATITANDYDSTTLNDEGFFYFTKVYINEDSSTFEGTVSIQFNFTTPYQIDSTSVKVQDETNDRYLDRDEFTFFGTGITIMKDTVGSVPKGSTRTYSVYFNLIKNEEEQAVDDAIGILKQPIINIGGYSILVGHLLAITFGGAAAIMWDPKKGKKSYPTMILAFFAAIVFIITHVGA